MLQAAAPPRPRVVLRQGQNLPEVGLHQCPSERKGEGGPVRSLHVPSHVPSQPQNAAKLRGFSLSASAFTAETDCPLEESGFEPLVPLQNRRNRGICLMSPTPERCMEAFYLQRTRFELAGIRARRWDREFESGLLQQPVCLSGEPRGCQRKAPHFGGGLRAAGDVRRDARL